MNFFVLLGIIIILFDCVVFTIVLRKKQLDKYYHVLFMLLLIALGLIFSNSISLGTGYKPKL